MDLQSFLTLLTTATIGIPLFIYLYVKLITFTYWKRHGIWQFPQTFPTGMALPLFWERQHMGDFFRNIYLRMRKDGRKYAGFYLLTKPQLMITDPDDIKHVLATDFKHFKNRGVWCHEELDPCSISLFSLPHERWKTIRGKLSPFFTPSRMKNIFPTMEACGPSLVEVTGEYADNNECFDMKDLIWRFTSTILGTCVFGYDCNTMKNPNDEVKLVGKDIFEPNKWEAMKRSLFFFMPQVLAWFKMSSNTDLVTNFFLNLAKTSIEHRENNNINRADLMQILVDLRQKNGSDKGVENGLTLNEIAAQCWIFFAGGFETAATLVTFCMYELSRNPDIQNKLREEVLEVLKNHDGKFTYESLKDMKYTEKIVNETLRKYPPLPFLNRECTSDSYTFPNSKITLRKGDAVVISPYGVQRDPEYYPDPDKFDPERFNGERYINPYTYLPFGEGPRNCIGMRMGIIQGIYTIALLISKFKFYFNHKTKVPLEMCKQTFSMSADGGIWLEAERV